MTKQDFIKKFPDVKVQQFETDTVLSKQEIKEMVKQFTNTPNWVTNLCWKKDVNTTQSETLYRR